MTFDAAHVRAALALTGGCARVGGVDPSHNRASNNRDNANRNNNASETRAAD